MHILVTQPQNMTAGGAAYAVCSRVCASGIFHNPGRERGLIGQRRA